MTTPTPRPPQKRTINVFVRDRDGKPLPGASISFTVDGAPAGSVPISEGRGSIELGNANAAVEITASYENLSETKKPGPGVDLCIFQFDVAGSNHKLQIAAIAIGLALLLLGGAAAFFPACLNAGQAFVAVVGIALGGGLMLYGFLRVFTLTVSVSGISAAGAGAVFVILYLFKPTILPTLICTQYSMPLRVVEGAVGTKAVPGATVQVRDNKTSVRTMNPNGEDSYPFSERELGHEVELVASCQGYADSTPKKVTLEQGMNTVVLHLDKVSTPSITSPSGAALNAPFSPFKGVIATKTTAADVSQKFPTKFCRLATGVSELRVCTFASLADCESDLNSLPPGPLRTNHKCAARPSAPVCYGTKLKDSTADADPHCYVDKATCAASIHLLEQMSGVAQPSTDDVCQPFSY